MTKTLATVSMLLLFVVSASSQQDKSEKFAIYVTGLDDAAPVAQSLIKKLKDSKPFMPVDQQDSSSKVVVLISCMPRKQTEPFVCMYVSHFNGATFKTFLGGGLYFSLNADDVANDFLGAIAQDIVERFDSTATDNLKQSLESCLLLTDTRCNVPDPLQKQLGAKQLTLGEYILKQRH